MMNATYLMIFQTWYKATHRHPALSMTNFTSEIRATRILKHIHIFQMCALHLCILHWT